ncbi:ABC transporter substrate-binding protein [Tessaracoccus aquimaris]|uniref:ABC transporter substrate-binding protein n=1 Tax=Tessaracoccus aquimaris TaxID=1332264 RepID=A0A1Q2CKI2_9ACTN|nr:ABC transporter substrate-binding protein [Tessaracoccus aquimaris]AQP46575.1 ABC transporter substrate-binding protein [Tessaracoccus aquimaris]
MFTTPLRRIVGLAAAGMLLTTSACGSTSPANEDPNAVAGDITVLTWRTDLLEDGTLDGFAKKFEEKYPDVKVSFEGITDYEGEVRTRMNTEDYGDVLAIPNSVTRDQLPNFFEPLGNTEEMSTTYRWLKDKSFEGTSYGIPVIGNANGVLINKRVWTEAGVTGTPTSPDEFIAAMKKIKANNPEVTPVYTNYKDGWPLTAWEYYRGAITDDVDVVNTMAHEDAPWAAGEDHAVIDGLLYDLVAEGLTEADPTSTNWELSKTMIAEGQVGAMFLGSWAIPQMRQAAEDMGANPDDISYIPFPAAVDGTLHAVAAGDYNLAVNKNSKHKAAARAFLDWFIDESGYAISQDGLTPQVDGELPATLKDFEATGVELITLNPPAEGEEALLTDIDKTAEVGLDTPKLRQGVVDAARNKTATKQELFDSLNASWTKARAEVG